MRLHTFSCRAKRITSGPQTSKAAITYVGPKGSRGERKAPGRAPRGEISVFGKNATRTCKDNETAYFFRAAQKNKLTPLTCKICIKYGTESSKGIRKPLVAPAGREFLVCKNTMLNLQRK
jgi:hypothetical protein